VGVGKTHILAAIDDEFRPWSLYITASHLESLVFETMKKDVLDDLVETLSSVPILLFDDLGSDYGATFAKSVFRRIIDKRYLSHDELLTVVATNLSENQIRIYDMRIADRILERGATYILPLEYEGSWRKTGGNHNK
jgi:DNA replication protein DnaC